MPRNYADSGAIRWEANVPKTPFESVHIGAEPTPVAELSASHLRKYIIALDIRFHALTRMQ